MKWAGFPLSRTVEPWSLCSQLSEVTGPERGKGLLREEPHRSHNAAQGEMVLQFGHPACPMTACTGRHLLWASVSFSGKWNG